MHIHSHSTYNIHTYIYNNGQRELNNKKTKKQKKNHKRETKERSRIVEKVRYIPTVQSNLNVAKRYYGYTLT